jgi:hypothetical protein
LTKFISILVCAISVSACEQTFNLSPSAPTSAPNINVTSTNTNTNTNTSDKTGSDTGPTSPPSDPSVPVGGVIPLPGYGETVTRLVSESNRTLLANSCQDKFGEIAWAYLDKLVQELRFHAGDSRWGYLCKDASCSKTARDVVAYRASSGNLGIWIVDVIGNHCPGPNDPAPAFRWGVLPFETVRPWTDTHK